MKDTYLVIVETPALHVGKNSPIEVRIAFLKKFINQSFVYFVEVHHVDQVEVVMPSAKCQ